MQTTGSSTEPSLSESGVVPVHGGRSGQGSAAADELHPIGFVTTPSPTVVPRTVIRCIIQGGFSSAERGRRVQRIACRSRTQFRLHEQIAERRVRQVVGRRGQDHLGIAGQLDGARQTRSGW